MNVYTMAGEEIVSLRDFYVTFITIPLDDE